MGYVITAIVVFVVIGIIGTIIGIYNALVQAKNNIDKAWANIDVILKQRHDELPKLIDTCKGFMKHERTLLEDLTRARTAFMNAPNTDAKIEAENQIQKGLKSIFAVAENYPDLKSNQNFIQLQNRISGLENDIADRREFFNESVNIYNIRIEQFPDVLVARNIGYTKRALLEIPKAETKDVDVKFD